MNAQNKEPITLEDVAQVVSQLVEKGLLSSTIGVGTERLEVQTQYKGMRVVLTLMGVDPQQVSTGTGFNITYKITDQDTIQVTVFPVTTYGVQCLARDTE